MTLHDCCFSNCQIYPNSVRRRNNEPKEANADPNIPDTDDPYSQDDEYCGVN